MNKYLATQKKLAYLEELYYNCCLLGKYESKMQKGPGARYKMQYQLLSEQVVPQSGMQKA